MNPINISTKISTGRKSVSLSRGNDLASVASSRKVNELLPSLSSRNFMIKKQTKHFRYLSKVPNKIYNKLSYSNWEHHWALKPLKCSNSAQFIKNLQRNTKNPKTYIDTEDIKENQHKVEMCLNRCVQSILGE
ncbi:hypothetical protein SteCoe_18783 [Stentor coeruleus]|uniref:Uncharacterized protein n=1 Tax=Stentor coeruleus TaxID=5963 RepID=A0A1R2BVT3_9CILI|nr:hypothetical protein SteCoe_18783 [Stentor coeruleus]